LVKGDGKGTLDMWLFLVSLPAASSGGRVYNYCRITVLMRLCSKFADKLIGR